MPYVCVGVGKRKRSRNLRFPLPPGKIAATLHVENRTLHKWRVAMQRFGIVLLSVLLAILASAMNCGPSQICEPGATQQCVCAAGNGSQSCKNDGSGWGECTCGASPGDGGSGNATLVIIAGVICQPGDPAKTICSAKGPCACLLVGGEPHLCGGRGDPPLNPGWTKVSTLKADCTKGNTGKVYFCGETKFLCDYCNKSYVWRSMGDGLRCAASKIIH